MQLTCLNDKFGSSAKDNLKAGIHTVFRQAPKTHLPNVLY